MTDLIRIKVPGKPQPRGSKVAIVLYDPVIDPATGRPERDGRGNIKRTPRFDAGGRVVLYPKDDNPKSGPYMARVAKVARAVMRSRRTIEGPLELTLRFYLARPGYHFGTGRNAGVVKERYRNARHIVKPDRLKLARAVEDALTGVVYRDDSQTVGGSVCKLYCDTEAEQRVEIEIVPLAFARDEQLSLAEQFQEAEANQQ